MPKSGCNSTQRRRTSKSKSKRSPSTCVSLSTPCFLGINSGDAGLAVELKSGHVTLKPHSNSRAHERGAPVHHLIRLGRQALLKRSVTDFFEISLRLHIHVAAAVHSVRGAGGGLDLVCAALARKAMSTTKGYAAYCTRRAFTCISLSFFFSAVFCTPTGSCATVVGSTCARATFNTQKRCCCWGRGHLRAVRAPAHNPSIPHDVGGA